MTKGKSIKPGGVDSYISASPTEAQNSMKKIRAAIQQVVPDAIETTSYFQMPGYSYPGYDYNGMFVWFSYKENCVRLHLRPPVIDNHKNQLAKYRTTKSIVSFSVYKDLPLKLIQELVLASLKQMRDKLVK
jgi:uncharacterized protein YdhG (YjbR/CyaY superfamily)